MKKTDEKQSELARILLQEKQAGQNAAAELLGYKIERHEDE